MRSPDWYVVQVESGREQNACEAIERACERAALVSDDDSPLLKEVFAPCYRARFKLHGEWHDEDRLLLPGYVVAVTEDPWKLARVIRDVLGCTRILTMGETFAPLKDEDRSWIERWTTEGDRTIPMSIAYKEGDRIVVTEGPLKGREGMIIKLRRRLCRAEVEVHAGTLTIRTTVGLAVLPGEQNK